MKRAEKIARARELREQGLLFREIAEAMGAPISSVDSWLNDPDLKKHMARRRKYGGTCPDCGASTDGSRGIGHAAERCQGCRLLYEAGRPGLERAEEKAAEQSPERQSEDSLLAAIRTVANGQPRLSHETYNAQSRLLGLPSYALICMRMGSWNEAVRRAGLKPNMSRRSYSRLSAEDCAAAVRRVADALGNMPSFRDYKAYRALEDPTLPSGALIKVRCDTWLNALRMASAIESERAAA